MLRDYKLSLPAYLTLLAVPAVVAIPVILIIFINNFPTDESQAVVQALLLGDDSRPVGLVGLPESGGYSPPPRQIAKAPSSLYYGLFLLAAYGAVMFLNRRIWQEVQAKSALISGGGREKRSRERINRQISRVMILQAAIPFFTEVLPGVLVSLSPSYGA